VGPRVRALLVLDSNAITHQPDAAYVDTQNHGVLGCRSAPSHAIARDPGPGDRSRGIRRLRRRQERKWLTDESTVTSSV